MNMPTAPASILIVDDNGAQMRALCDTLRDQGFETTGYTGAADALQALQETKFDLLLSDLAMPGMDGIALIAAAAKIDPDLACIIMTGKGTISTAVEAMKTGALDYLLKPFNISAALPMLKRALEIRQLRLENVELKLRLEQEERINKLTRIYAVLSGINSAIVRIRDRGELFKEACRIATEAGRFGFAWIDMVDPETLELIPAVHDAAETGFAMPQYTETRVPLSKQGLISHAIAQKRAVFSNDLLTESVPGGPRRAEAMRHGYRSVVVLPLIVDGDVVATLTLFAKEQGFFNEEEMRLLNELSGDISFGLEFINKEEKLDFLAYYSALTGLPNSLLFNNRLAQRVAAARDKQQVFGVLMLDIERFRLINDTLGRHGADEVLQQVSRRLQQQVTGADLLAHTSGNQFVVATRRAEEPELVVRMLEQILGAIASEPFYVPEAELRLAMRAGVSMFPTDGVDAENLVRNAEAALAQSKESGERYLFYAPAMNARAAEQLKLESGLRRAIDAGEFVLYYQPRVELSTRRIMGLEALIRWQHPNGDLVPPARFIPILEDTGLILNVGRWALRRAALDHAAWCAAGLAPGRVAVNISAVQLRQKDFIEDVATTLVDTGGARDFMDIEVTESMLLDNIEDTIWKLREIQALGMQIALDDFGTGYSSLSYLSRLPINALKIDRSFVCQMRKTPEQAAIVSTIISLGRALNVTVVAEGVETEEEAAMLQALHCAEAQGYLFARPMPAAKIVSLLLAESRPPAQHRAQR
jgi:diguanylate cyclase (GGDEF)-like protein